MDRIIEKLDELSEHLNQIRITMAVQAQQLAEHMRRTDLLEKKIDQVETEVYPLRDSLIELKGIKKFIVLSGVVMTIIGVLIKVIKW